MPIYEYKCDACGELHEFIQKFSEEPMRECPGCGELRLRKLISAAAFHLKGSGWYVTDFRDQDKNKAKAKDAAEKEAKSKSSSAQDSDGQSGSESSAAKPASTEKSKDKNSGVSSAASD